MAVYFRSDQEIRDAELAAVRARAAAAEAEAAAKAETKRLTLAKAESAAKARRDRRITDDWPHRPIMGLLAAFFVFGWSLLVC